MSTAQERLQGGYYNSGSVSGANPGGLGNGGHVPNFPTALQDIGTVSQDVGTKAGQVQTDTATAAAAALAAGQDRVLAQQAAVAAATFNPAAYVPKAGGTFDNTIAVGAGAMSGVSIMRGDEAGTRGGRYIVRQSGLIAATMGYSSSTQVFLTTDAARTWVLTGAGFTINGVAPFTTANDGAGSGLDADLLRGLAPAAAATASTVVQRDANGSTAFNGVTVGAAGVIWSNGAVLTVNNASSLWLKSGLYMDGALSASDITHRSDRRLKRSIVDLDESSARLRPVSFELKATGARRVGFIAQEVAEVRPGAVRENWEGVLEIDTVALIAELAHQLNRALDRIDALEASHDAA